MYQHIFVRWGTTKGWYTRWYFWSVKNLQWICI